MSLGLRRASSPDGPVPAHGPSGTQRAARLSLASLLLLVTVVVALHIHAFVQLSPIDELHHVDYMLKAADGQLLRRGDVIGPETRRDAACRGVDFRGEFPPNCGADAWLAGREFNTEEIQPPAYYFLTAWTARALRPFIGTSSLVVAARMVGALWLVAGVVCLWAALALLGARLLSRWAVGAIVATTPVVLHASATVTNDATGLVAGGGMLLAALAWERHRVPGFVVILATVLGVSLRLTNLVGAGVIAVYLVLRARRPPDAEVAADRSPRSFVMMAAAVAGAVVVTGVAWVAFNAAVARVGPLENPNTFNQQAASLPVRAVLDQLGATVTPVHDPFYVSFLRNGAVRAVVTLTDWLLLGSAVGLAALSRRGSRAESLGAAAILCAVATGPVLTLSSFLFQGAFFPIPARYGLSIVPALAAALALSLEKRWARAGVAWFAGAAAVMTLVLAL